MCAESTRRLIVRVWVRPVMAHFSNSLRCGDHVWLQTHLHRRGQASGMRARDPLPTSRTSARCDAAIALVLARDI